MLNLTEMTKFNEFFYILEIKKGMTYTRVSSRKIIQKKVPTVRRDLPLSRKSSEKILAPDELKALFAKRDEKLEQKRIFIGKIIKRLRNASRSGHFENIKKILKQLKIRDHIDAGTSQGLTGAFLSQLF